MRTLLRTLFCIIGVLSLLPSNAEATSLEIEWPQRRLWVGAHDVDGIVLRAVEPGGQTAAVSGAVLLTGLGVQGQVRMRNGVAVLPTARIEASTAGFEVGDIRAQVEVPRIRPWLSLLPAGFAITLALLSRQVLLALFAGLYVGGLVLGCGPLQAFGAALDTMVMSAADADHTKSMIFTLMMGGMVGIVSASGGVDGIVASLVRFAKTPRSASLTTWGMGMVVFFDDYASTLLVGNTMRPITDRLNVSREKLAYIVDSTAAPIASLAVVSTWIGYEVSVLADAMAAAGIEREGYEVFISGLSSRFYPIFALFFVALVAAMGRDFGPMLKAERRARRGEGVLSDRAQPLMDSNVLRAEGQACAPRAWLAWGPIGTLIVVALVVMISTGLDGTLQDPAAWAEAVDGGIVRAVGFVLSHSASYDALVYGAGAGVATALGFAVMSGALSIGPAFDALVRGVQAMVMAAIVLVLAWSMGSVMAALHAGEFVSGALGGTLPLWSVPSLAFVSAALIALATGSSWATMAVLFPVVIPVVAAGQGEANFETIFLASSSAVLGGAVFGDHCSPISDTTVLSSLACASDHVDHTRTQAPYASVVALITLGVGYVPAGFGVSPWISVFIGVLVLGLMLRVLGQRVETERVSPELDTSAKEAAVT